MRHRVANKKIVSRIAVGVLPLVLFAGVAVASSQAPARQSTLTAAAVNSVAMGAREDIQALHDQRVEQQAKLAAQAAQAAEQARLKQAVAERQRVASQAAARASRAAAPSPQPIPSHRPAPTGSPNHQIRHADNCLYGATPSPEVEQTIRAAAAEFGVDAERMLRTADGESDFTPSRVGPGGSFLGLFQQAKQYWAGRVADFNQHVQPNVGGDIFNAADNARVSAWMMSRQGWGPWQCKG